MAKKRGRVKGASYGPGEKMEDVQIPKRIPKSFLVNFNLGNVATLGNADLEKLIKSAYRQLNKNLREFEKAKIISPAFEQYYEDVKRLKYSEKWGLRQRQHEFQKAVIALRAKTITLEGAKNYWKEVEQRIFGTVDEYGNLIPKEHLERKEHLTANQRKRYWQAYSEFRKNNQVDFNKYGSNKIQQFLAQESFWRTRKYRSEDFIEMLKKLDEDDLTETEEQNSDSNNVQSFGNVNKI